jgi:hypothetical protein
MRTGISLCIILADMPILNNYAAHKHHTLRWRLKRHPRLTFYFTPTSASWLNAIQVRHLPIYKRRARRIPIRRRPPGRHHSLPRWPYGHDNVARIVVERLHEIWDERTRITAASEP